MRSFWNSLLPLLLLSGALWSQEPSARHSFTFRDEALRTAFDSLIRWYGLPIVFLEQDVAGRWISTGCVDCTIDRAMAEVLAHQGLRATRISGQIVIRAATGDEGNATVAVNVVDSITGEPLQGASVVLRSTDTEAPDRWGTTGIAGFFSFRDVSSGPHALSIRRVGYETAVTRLELPNEGEMFHMVRLVPRELMQPHVTVEGRRSAFGAADGISRGIFIRSIPSDQHQYFLDGARVYQPIHTGGLTSAFNGDAIRDVHAVGGGMPPYYGGRIGGVMDVSVRPGSRESTRGMADLGTLGAGVVIDGPLAPSTTFLISGRQQYPDLLSRFSYPDNNPTDLHAGELLFKVEQQVRERQTLSVTGYVSRDAVDRDVTGGPLQRLDNSIRWTNAAGSVRWHGLADPALLFSAGASYTEYRFSSDQRHLSGGGAPLAHLSEAAVRDLSMQAHAEYFYDRYHTMVGGFDIVRHALSGSVDPFTSQLATTSLGGPAPWELSVYVQDQWRLTPSILAELGARATSFMSGDAASSSVDPRFSLLVQLNDDRRISGSISVVTQYLHPYRHSGLFLYYPSIFFYASDARIPPTTSLHGAIGLEQLFADDRYRLAVEAYGRVTRNLHEFAADSTLSPTAQLGDALLLGEGATTGVELTLDRRTGPLTGTIRYSWSWTTHQFAELNGGRPFQPRFDRRHEVFAAWTYALTPDWTFGALALLSSNHLPIVETTSQASPAVTAEGEVRLGADAMYAEPFDLNGGRLPGFQRIELRVSYAFDLLDRRIETTLRLLNGYGLIDPFRWDLEASSDPRARWSISYEPPPLFPMYPSLSLRVKI